MSKYVALALIIALSLLACMATFALLAGSGIGSVLVGFGISYPACLLLCAAYYKMVSRLARVPMFRGHGAARVACDWLCATIVGVSVSMAARFAVAGGSNWQAGTMAFALWNSMAVLGVELLAYHQRMLQKEAQLARAEKEKAAYQFEALKQQINPHFLFNSLNALASLAYQDAEKTNRFAKRLSSVYRYLLQTADKPLVSLRDELDFLDSYLYLENIRFGRAVQVSVDIADSAKAMRVVPASLQLLVENALKHNIATEERPLRISIGVHDGWARVDNVLQLRGDVASNKKGLQNLRRQYEAFGLSIRVENSGTVFSVALPLV